MPESQTPVHRLVNRGQGMFDACVYKSGLIELMPTGAAVL